LLVAITLYYARQAHETVKEMRAARGAQVLPKLIPAFKIVPPVVLYPRVVNIGPGSATDIECKLKLEPKGPEWSWRWPLLTPGEGQEFTPRGNHPDGTPFQPLFEELKRHYTHLSLEASYRDAMGQPHHVATKAEIAETFELAQTVGVHPPAQGIDEIAKHLGKAAEELAGLRKAMPEPSK
jgi:hypothetical protein